MPLAIPMIDFPRMVTLFSMTGLIPTIFGGVFNEEERKYCESLRQRRRNNRRNSQRNVSTVETKNSKDDTKPAASAGNGMSQRRQTRE